MAVVVRELYVCRRSGACSPRSSLCSFLRPLASFVRCVRSFNERLNINASCAGFALRVMQVSHEIRVLHVLRVLNVLRVLHAQYGLRRVRVKICPYTTVQL